jgi:hypothetical protein
MSRPHPQDRTIAWYSFPDWMPPDGTMLLVYIPVSYNGHNGIHYGYWNFHKKRFETLSERGPDGERFDLTDARRTGTDNSVVTHWSQLPQPPHRD